ncbi:MAG TPA: DUF4156 domain-containing protein [Gammaproteobacteria bacterium]|nr:DUF4156 domain-containing protein [Gammaproteobacteria bacterium]
MRWIIAALATGAVLLTAGCGNWVEVKPAARDVTVLDLSQAANCQRLGTSSAAVQQNAGFFARNPQAVDADLVNLARNDAVKMGGNAVAALEPRSQGHQRFGIYRCGAEQLSRRANAEQPANDDDVTGIKTIPYQPPQ